MPPLTERKQAREGTAEYYDQQNILQQNILQQNILPGLKASIRPALQEVHSQVLQVVARRLHKAFDAYFRRLKAGETPGYPRFRGRGRCDSLTFPKFRRIARSPLNRDLTGV